MRFIVPKTLVISLLVILFVSCRKDDKFIDPREIQTSDIYYVDVEPEITINNIDSMGHTYLNADWDTCGPYPYTSSPSEEQLLDVDGDGIDDFYAKSAVSYNGPNTPHTCPTAYTTVQFSSFKNENSRLGFVVGSYADYYMKSLVEGEKITDLDYFFQTTFFYLTQGTNYPSGTFYGGIVLRKNNEPYCGWIRFTWDNNIMYDPNVGLTIHEYAISNTPWHYIEAGQKE